MKLTFISLAIALAFSGCASTHFAGVYEGSPMRGDIGRWSIEIREDGEFVAARFYKNPKLGAVVDGEPTIELGDLSYRGRWTKEGSKLLLTRNDGKTERLEVKSVLGHLVLVPQRKDQPELRWTRIAAYD
jgi:hypothetical protein